MATPNWRQLEVWTLHDAVFAPLMGAELVDALRAWRRANRRRALFVRIRGSRTSVRHEDVDWSDFPSEDGPS
ncbi:MAG TPA: hypothetical protein VHB21_18385 [Minicystis sp.]|nr:hypothetical protein [Minicystis sp.]